MSMPGRNKRKERSSEEPQVHPPSGIPSSSADHDHLSSTPSTRPRFPPGFKYRPNDLDVLLLLCKKRDYLDGNRDLLVDLPIHRVNIYESNPEQLSVQFRKGNDTEWFFLMKRNKMGKAEKRQKRGDDGGYWHATVKAKTIDEGQGQGLVGSKTALSYYVGKRPRGEKSSWLMHEYCVDQSPNDADDDVKEYSLCKIYRSPQAINKMKAEEEENERKKKALEKKKVVQQQQQPPTLEYHQPQPQPHHDIAYQQQVLFQPAPLDSYQPHQWQFRASRRSDSPQLQPYYDFAYQQLIRAPEEENVGVTQNQQQQPSLAPPPRQGQDSRSMMVMSQEDVLDTDGDFFDMIDRILKDGEEQHGDDTQHQQQQESTPIPPPPQGQDSTSVMMTNDVLWDPAEFFDIEQLLEDMDKLEDIAKGHNVFGPQDN